MKVPKAYCTSCGRVWIGPADKASQKVRDDIAARFCYASGLFDSKQEIACNMDHPTVKNAYVAADLLIASYDLSTKAPGTETRNIGR